MPITGSNLDFSNPLEAQNALQRNPQVDVTRVAAGAVTITTNAIMAVVAAGTVIVSDTGGTIYTIATPGMAFPFGAPTTWSPGYGPVTFTSSATYSVIYHL